MQFRMWGFSRRVCRRNLLLKHKQQIVRDLIHSTADRKEEKKIFRNSNEIENWRNSSRLNSWSFVGEFLQAIGR